MLCGLPGSGKTTLAKKLENERQAIRLCPDEWVIALIPDRNIPESDRLRTPIEKLLFETAQKLAQLGVNVILENGFWTKSERDSYRDNARKLGIKVELHFLDVHFDKLWTRLNERNKNLQLGDFKISFDKLKQWHKLFEPPTEEEMKTYDSFN